MNILDKYNHRELQFVNQIESFLTISYARIEEISNFIESKKKPNDAIIIDDKTEVFEITDPETEKIFNYLFETSKYNETSFFYNSIFVNLYSFLEYTLINFSKYLNERDKKQYVFTLNPKQYIYFDNCIVFLNTQYGLNFGQNDDYNQLILYKRIRDIIIHNQSILPEDEEYKAIKRVKGLYITDYNYVYIKDISLLLTFIKRIKKFVINDIIDKTKINKNVC